MRKVVVKAGRIGVRAQEEKRYLFLWNGRIEELRKKAKLHMKTETQRLCDLSKRWD